MTGLAAEALMSRVAQAPLPDWRVFVQAISVSRVAAGASVFRPGDKDRRIFIVRSGLIKLVYSLPDGDEWIKSFIPEEKFFACSSTLQSGAAAGFGAEAMEPSELEHCPFSVLETLANLHIEWAKTLNALLLDFAAKKEERERVFLTMKPADRFVWLKSTMPRLIDRVPQKDLAAYLGVTPVGLNRIIKRLEKN